MRGIPTAAVTPRLATVIADQQSIVTRAQLNAAGLHDMAIARRIRWGIWQRVLPATYLMGNGPLTREQQNIAASLYAGEPCQITGAAALRTYGFRYAPPDDRVQVLVPHEERRKSTGFVLVQRTLELDPRARVNGLYQVCSPARAVIDLGRQTTDLRLTRAVMSEAVQWRHASLDQLDEEVRRAGRSRTAVVRHVLQELTDGVRSAPEAELRTLLETSTVLPRALWNPTLRTTDGLRLPTPDAYIHEAALAFEVDSQEFHANPVGWATTFDRDNQLGEVGIDTAHFTPAEIRRSPGRTLRRAERIYLRRVGQVPEPSVLIIPR